MCERNAWSASRNRYLRSFKVDGRATVVLLTMTPSMSLSRMTSAISVSCDPSRLGAILSTRRGRWTATSDGGSSFRALTASLSKLCRSSRFCSPLSVFRVRQMCTNDRERRTEGQGYLDSKR